MNSKKHKLPRRLLAILLTICMFVTMLPSGIFAEPNGSSDGQQNNAGITTDVQATSKDGLNITKSVIGTEESGYSLRLEAYATEEVTTSTTTTPLDIILVLDISTSMADDGKLDAMKNAANSFIDSVTQKAGSTDHRIGIVSFESNATVEQELTSVQGAGAQTLKAKVNQLRTPWSGATRVDFGLTKAKEELDGANRDSKKVVIVFTDGEPTSGSSFENEVAAAAINKAYDLKANDTTVYTIGMFDGADSNDMNGQINKYMNAMSSNYPDATAKGSNGFWEIRKYLDITNISDNDRSEGDYYFSATQANLDSVFMGISETLTQGNLESHPNAGSILSDTLSDYFTLSDSTDTSEITVEEVEAISYNESDGFIFATAGTRLDTDDGIEVSIADGKTINVTGFDYEANVVSRNKTEGTVTGSKLVVTIPIIPDTNCLIG